MADDVLALPEAELHLWLCEIDPKVGAAELDAYRALLTPDEAAQAARFVFDKDRRRYLFTRALVRSVLSRYAGERRLPGEWRFELNAQGCPRVANPLPGRPPPVFNLSHTDDLVVLALRAGQAVGVDVERLDRRPRMDIAGHFFAAEELAALRSLPEAEQAERFMEYWTFKESYIKARTLGLSIPLDGFAFAMASSRTVSLSVKPDGDDAAAGERWQFWQFRPTPEHVLAVCTERQPGWAIGWQAWQVRPLSAAPPQRIELQPTRSSHLPSA